MATDALRSWHKSRNLRKLEHPSSKARIDAARKAAALSDETLHAEEEKLLTGLSTPYEVIRRQRDLRAAQFEYVRARTNYAKASVELNRSTGVMLEKQ